MVEVHFIILSSTLQKIFPLEIPSVLFIAPVRVLQVLGCPGPWRFLDRFGRILKEEEVCLGVPLRLEGPPHHDNGMYDRRGCGKRIGESL